MLGIIIIIMSVGQRFVKILGPRLKLEKPLVLVKNCSKLIMLCCNRRLAKSDT